MNNIVWTVFACVNLFAGIMMIHILCSKLDDTRGGIIWTTTLLWANVAFLGRSIWHLQI